MYVDGYTAPADEVILSNELATFYSPEYQFLPTIITGSITYSSSLYNIYGDVDYPFQLKVNDIFAAYDESGSYFESRILDIYRANGDGTGDPNLLRVKLDKSLSLKNRKVQLV